MKFFKKYTSHIKYTNQPCKNIKNSSNYEIIRDIKSMEYSPYREDNKVELFFDSNYLKFYFIHFL